MTITVIVCAYNEARLLPACLYSLLAQTRPPDEILVVNNASTDETGAVARAVPGVRVIDEPDKGLVVARETARRAAQTDIVAYIDADCRVPITWLERVERRFREREGLVGVTGPYRFYDWDWSGRALIRAYDVLVAPPTHALVHHALGIGAIFLRRQLRRPPRRARAHRRLRPPIEFPRRGHQPRPPADAVGDRGLVHDCWVWTSARRYRAMGKAACSACTCATSGRRSCGIGRPIATIST